MANENSLVAIENRVKTFRWFFYISSLQVFLFFAIPALIFPNKRVLQIEAISALTLGLVVALFFLLVNVCGLLIDKTRRSLYVVMIVLVGLWLLWAVISWSYIEYMDYLLH